MIRIKAPRAGFILLAIALHLAVVAYILYTQTFDAFHYQPDNWVFALMFIAIWSIVALLISSFFMGDKPLFVDALYIVIMFALVTATIKFITPCLSPIGIYYTVHNMGDVEANAVGVPLSIEGAVFFVLTILFVLVSSFFLRNRKEVVKKIEQKVPTDNINESANESVNEPAIESTGESVSEVYDQVMDEAVREADNV